MMDGVVDALLKEIRDPLINGDIPLDSIRGIIRIKGGSVSDDCVVAIC